ncbi:MAG: protein kinase [Acidobacteriota bacterium]
MRFETGTFLGRGGMGEVYKVWDPRLERHVALKVLRAYSEEAAGRLMREARAQARLDHPNICKVYEVGEDADRPYIAMQCIEGAPLDEVAESMTLEQRVRVIAQVAEAVHEAHRTGLIHRDLKPSNILIEEETLRPYVVDFGLVHQEDGTCLTVEGAVLGTPPYMAPEQADGGSAAVDRRSDVYSLGATLYELLTGQAVFAGSATEILFKTLHQEPRSPRVHDGRLPADLAVVVLKCLEKQPERRYDSARSLAADLWRFLDGEPILAKPPSLAYRLVKKARKHRALAAVVAVAGGAILVFAFLALEARWRGQREAEAAQRFTAEVKDLEWLLRAARMSPRHDIRPQRQAVTERLAALEGRAASASDGLRGPASYALGRGYLALGDLTLARRHLEAAQERGYRPPEAAYALGVVYGRLYEQAADAAAAISDRAARATTLAQAEAELRAPARALLEASRGSLGGQASYLEGLIAFYSDQMEDSLEFAEVAVREAPWMYEAHLLRGDVLAAAGDALRMAGDRDAASERFGLAGEAYERAGEVAASAAEVPLRLCELWAKRMEMAVYGRGDDTAPLLEEGLQDCRAGLEIDPDSASIESAIASLWTVRTVQLEVRGEKPAQAWQEAETHARRAVDLDPENSLGWMRLASVYNDQARFRMQSGEQPAVEIEQALEAVRRGIAAARNPAFLLNLEGMILNRRARFERSSGNDPTVDLAAAIGAYDAALEVDPRYGYALNNLGRAFTDRARWIRSQGGDPEADLASAVGAYRRALEINPENAFASNNLGVALMDRGLVAMERGRDPRQDLEEADAALGASLEVNPDYASAHNNRGMIRLNRGRFENSRGRDPSAFLAAAIVALDETVRLHGRAFQPHVNLGRVEAIRARWNAAQGADPLPSLAAARQHYREALERNPRYAAGLAELADVWVMTARWAVTAELRRQAHEALERRAAEALAIDPSSVAARRALVAGALLRAEAPGAPRRELLEAADGELRRALGQRSSDARCGLLAVRLGRLWAELEPERRESHLRRALETLAPALEGKPGDPELLAARGLLGADLGDGEGDALEDLSRSLELNPRPLVFSPDELMAARDRLLSRRGASPSPSSAAQVATGP